MNRRWYLSRLILVFATVTAVSVFAVPAQAAEGTFARTLTVTGPVELEVATGSGDITVRVGEPGSVKITGHIKTRSRWLGGGGEEAVRRIQENPPIEQEGNRIRVKQIEDRELRRNVSISYELVVPRETSLEAGTGSGDQNIDGIRGPVKAGTGSGSIRLSAVGDEARVSTGSGDIKIESVSGNLHASTGSGSIHATGIGGSISASTGSGDVRLTQSAPGDVSVSTGSGSVEIRGLRGSLDVGTGSGDITAQGEPTGAWNLETSSGDVSVSLPAEGGFDIQARTSSGSISTEHPLTVRGKIGRREVRGQIRGGGVLIAVRTSSGSIRIE